MRRKCRSLGEIRVMEVADAGVQTSTPASMAATETVEKKRRRLNDDEEKEAEYKVASSSASAMSYVQFSNRRFLADRHRRRNKNRFLISNSVHDEVSRCSSSIGSSEKRIIELLDLEDENTKVEASAHLSRRERKETTPSSSELRPEPEDLNLMSRPSEANSSRRSTAEKMPTEAELEEIFAAAERQLQKQFAEKYNYDIVKDEPLEGRYEWVPLKP